MKSNQNNYLDLPNEFGSQFMQTSFFKTHLNLIPYLVFFTLMYFALPWSVHGILFFILFQIALFFKYGIQLNIKQRWPLMLPIFFFFWVFIGYFYSQNKAEALFDLQVKLSFLILPLLFLFMKKEQIPDLKTIAKSYAIISLLNSSILLILSLLHFINHGSLTTYTFFSVAMHPSYLALFLTLNLAFIWHLLQEKLHYRWVYLLSFALSLLAVFMSASKAGIITVFVWMLWVLATYLFPKYKLKAWLAIAGLLFAFILVLTQSSRFQIITKLPTLYRETFAHPEKVEESTALRLLTWNAGWEVVKTHPIFGVGSGDMMLHQNQVYQEKNYRFPFEKQLNPHQQFIETWASQGIFALLSLISMIVLPWFLRNYRKFLLLTLSLTLLINFALESILNHQSGVVIMALMFSLLITVYSKPQPSQS
jgi:O-antigen ligase